MEEYLYQIYTPGGNATALVFGLENNIQLRKSINDGIMKKFSFIEQVGFVSTDITEPQLVMAGGEFCGNATRCAAWHFLKGTPGELSISVSGVSRKLKAGVTKEFDAWAEMPVCNELRNIVEIEEGFFLVKLEGIVHIVIMPEKSKHYLNMGDFKSSAKSILAKYQLLDATAAGVIFLEKESSVFKIHPCVHVLDVNTLFYETACGTGTIAVGLAIAKLESGTIEIPILQPSLKTINAIVCCNGTEVTKALISGKIEVDNYIYRGIK